MLEEILPIENIRNKFPGVQLSTIGGRQKLPELERQISDKLHHIGMQQWDRLLENKVSLRSIDISDYANNSKAGVLKFISNKIAQPLVKDISYQRATAILNGQEEIIAEILIAHLYPNDLHLADIEYKDPNKPLPEDQVIGFKKYKGLGLIEDTIERLKKVGKELGCSTITLTAANIPLKNLFSRYGFRVSNTRVGRFHKEQGTELTIPMDLPIIKE